MKSKKSLCILTLNIQTLSPLEKITTAPRMIATDLRKNYCQTFNRWISILTFNSNFRSLFVSENLTTYTMKSSINLSEISQFNWVSCIHTATGAATPSSTFVPCVFGAVCKTKLWVSNKQQKHSQHQCKQRMGKTFHSAITPTH